MHVTHIIAVSFQLSRGIDVFLRVENVVSVTDTSEAVSHETLNRVETLTLNKGTILIEPTYLYLFMSVPSHSSPRPNILMMAKKGDSVNCENVFSTKNYNYRALEQQHGKSQRPSSCCRGRS